MSLLVPLLLAACAPSAPGEETDAEPVLPVHEVPDPEPELDADGVGELLRELTEPFPDPWTLYDTYVELLSQGDERCPGKGYRLDDSHLLGCTAESGYHYAGICGYDHFSAAAWDGSFEQWMLGGCDFEILTPDGMRFGGAGNAMWIHATPVLSSGGYDAAIVGTWSYDGAEGWLGEGLSAHVEYDAGGAEGARWLEVRGGIGVGDVDLWFEPLRWDEAACDGQPTGGVRIRDPRGYWYDWDLGEDCEPCAEVIFHGDTSVGTLCLDLAPSLEALHGRMVNE